MNRIPFSAIELKDGFWKKKQQLVWDVTTDAVYNRFKDTKRFEALSCTWKEGDDYYPHIFWDSDVAKWIEGVAYQLQSRKNPQWECICDAAIDEVVKNADEHGYFNSHYLVTEQEKRFSNRDCHELYCLGHWIEAAIAYKHATGKSALFDVMRKYADYVDECFRLDATAGFVTPGHPELELALMKLYKETDDPRYRDLAKFFITRRGIDERDAIEGDTLPATHRQDDGAIQDRDTADGHAVRALYLYAGVADVAAATANTPLLEACERIFENVQNKRMYITGGCGSTANGEAFTLDYDLPARTAYAETCASIALVFFAERMGAILPDAKYADVAERAMYNGVLSGISMKGNAFFYENPLAIDPALNHGFSRFPITERREVFDCSCCPPNLVRFIPSIADTMYVYDDNTLFVNQYIPSEARFDGMAISMSTRYPTDGEIAIVADTGDREIALRIPGWCRSFKLDRPYVMKNGYAVVAGGGVIRLSLDMPITPIRGNRRLHDAAGRVAITRGPIVYCAESVDNGEDIAELKIDTAAPMKVGSADFLLPSIEAEGYIPPKSAALYLPDTNDDEKVTIRLIPYYAFANRGTAEMAVWLLKK